MTRYLYGGTSGDFAFAVGGANVVQVAPSSVLTFWSAQTGGTQYTDLLLGGIGGTPATTITTNTIAQVPVFAGPDTITQMWVSAGGGPRILMLTTTRATRAAIRCDGVEFALNDAGLTAALAAAAGEGISTLIPAGVTVTLTGTVALPTKTHLILDGTIRHTATSGAALTSIGTEGSTVALTSNATAGSYTVVATSHGLVAGDWFRLGSTKVYDASSTSSTIGEILRVESVSGSTITTNSPIMGGPYNTADTATVSKLTPVDGVVIEGVGSIVGNKAANTEQLGIQIQRGYNCHVRGILVKDIDQRHVFFRDVVHFTIERLRSDWASHATHAYSVSISDACQYGKVIDLFTRNTRHAFTTNNSTSGKGIPRHIKVVRPVVESTLPSTTGSGGDALDTHTAAEYIDFIDPTVLSSTGQGINVECPIARVTGARVFNTVSHGICFHNESDAQGRIELDGNFVDTAGGDGIRVALGTRGTVATYDYVVMGQRNRTRNITGNPVNAGISDDDGYRSTTIASDAVTVYPSTRFLVVDTEAAASTDNLANITGGRRGQVMLVKTAANARDVTLTQTGNIRMAANTTYTLDAARDGILLAYDGTTWNQAGAGDFAAA